MKITNNIPKTKPTRTINTCTKDEAFRLGNEWYTKIEMNDVNVRYHDQAFINTHALLGHRKACWNSMMPCIHISSMAFVYVNGDCVADEWAELSATLTTP